MAISITDGHGEHCHRFNLQHLCTGSNSRNDADSFREQISKIDLEDTCMYKPSNSLNAV